MPRRAVPKECRARILSAFEEYAFEIDRSDRSPSTKKTYISHAYRFVRWIEEPEILRSAPSEGGGSLTETVKDS